ncbi:MAG: phosphatidate cytidylyltransferase [Dehalococcoidia bacterium]|nr:phosphatidate cytidylyltransferase [Dehalococcoidia bacterium]
MLSRRVFAPAFLCYNLFVLRLRIATAAVGLPLIVVSILLGPLPYGTLLGVVGAVCTYEISRMAPASSRVSPLVCAAVALAVVLACGRLMPLQASVLSFAVTLPVVVSLVLLLSRSGGHYSFAQWSWSMAGALYVGLLLGHWAGVYLLPAGMTLAFFGVFTTFFYDTFAYFTGRTIGRHKLAPRLSAGKTWEGVCGGLAMAVVGGLIVRAIALRLLAPFPFNPTVTVLASLCIAVAAQAGDLVESAVKRSAGVKDAGGVLPGHGGMLDRFDSLLFTGPMLYYFALAVTA